MKIDGGNAFGRKSDLFVYYLSYSIGMFDERFAVASFQTCKSFSSNVIGFAYKGFSGLVISGEKFINTLHVCPF